MTRLEYIASKLKQDFPPYQFDICRGLFEKYIAVDIHEKISFTIWVSNNSGYAELLDEVDFYKSDWLKKKLNTHLIHWSKYRKLWRRDYPRIILEKMELNLPERKVIRKRLEQSLQRIHII